MQDNNLNNEQNNVQPEQNFTQPEQVQPVEQPVIYVQESKKNNGLLVILLLIIIAMAGFIIWDKVIKKEEPVNNKPINEPVNEPVNEPAQDSKYFTIETVNKTLNGKEVKVEYKYFMEEQNDVGIEYVVATEIFVNGKKVATSGPIGEVYSDSQYTKDGAITAAKEKMAETTKKLQVLGQITSDNDYLYLKVIKPSMTSEDTKIIVLDANFNIIFEKQINKEGRSIDDIDTSCPRRSQYLEDKEGYGMYYIDGNSLYYIEDNEACSNAKGTEYKVTFANNQATSTKLGEYEIEYSGACA